MAVGDVNGDGKADIVGPLRGRAPETELKVFSGTGFKELGRFLIYDVPWMRSVSVGDTDGDGRAEIVDGLDAGCCTTVHVVDGRSGAELGSDPFGQQFQSGARVVVADLNGDGKTELCVVPLAGNRVSAFGPGGGEPFRMYETSPGTPVGRRDRRRRRPRHVEAGLVATALSVGVQVNVIDTHSPARCSRRSIPSRARRSRRRRSRSPTSTATAATASSSRGPARERDAGESARHGRA